MLRPAPGNSTTEMTRRRRRLASDLWLQIHPTTYGLPIRIPLAGPRLHRWRCWGGGCGALRLDRRVIARGWSGRAHDRARSGQRRAVRGDLPALTHRSLSGRQRTSWAADPPRRARGKSVRSKGKGTGYETTPGPPSSRRQPGHRRGHRPGASRRGYDLGPQRTWERRPTRSRHPQRRSAVWVPARAFAGTSATGRGGGRWPGVPEGGSAMSKARHNEAS